MNSRNDILHQRGAKPVQKLSGAEVIKSLSEHKNPATAFFAINEVQQRSAFEQLWVRCNEAEVLRKQLETHEYSCPAADATICMNMHKGQRIPNPDASDDEEDIDWSEIEDADTEAGPVKSYPPDNGYLLRKRFTSEWQYLPSPPKKFADLPSRVECRWDDMDLWHESRQDTLKVCAQHMPKGKECEAGLCEKHYPFKYSSGMMISSQLLLYRLTTAFGLPVIRFAPEDVYKQCWVVFLKHVEDDKSFLKLGEWKVNLSLMPRLTTWLTFAPRVGSSFRSRAAKRPARRLWSL